MIVRCVVRVHMLVWEDEGEKYRGTGGDDLRHGTSEILPTLRAIAIRDSRREEAAERRPRWPTSGLS